MNFVRKIVIYQRESATTGINADSGMENPTPTRKSKDRICPTLSNFSDF